MKSLKYTTFFSIFVGIGLLIASCSAIKPMGSSSPEISDSTKVEKKGERKEPSSIVETKTHANNLKVKSYCEKINKRFKRYKWGDSQCENYSWHHVRNSHKGNPIIWYVYGEELIKQKKDYNTTMILCGVHGDEITPIKFCFDVLNDLKKYPELFEKNVVILAPIVTPDSFFTKYPSRTNARGVDVNRNFPTKDWSKKALALWKSRYGGDARRFPGKYAMSEQETVFQVNLINLYKPDKVISVHAPLTLLDYDGPTFSQTKGAAAKELLVQMSDSAGKYKISNYPFFPGSLGNWAGNERKIPTYTLELPNSDWTKTDEFFNMFKSAIMHAIRHDLKVDMLEEKFTKAQNHNHE